MPKESLHPNNQKIKKRVAIIKKKIVPFSSELLAIELVNGIISISVVIKFLRKIKNHLNNNVNHKSTLK